MIICAGQALLDCIVTKKEYSPIAEDISLCPGGEAFNEASVFAALGDEVILSAAIGQDYAGTLISNEAQKMGIRVFSNSYSGRTPVSMLNVDERGGRSSLTSKVHALTDYSPLFALPSAQFVTMGSLFRPPFLDPQVCLKFARAAKSSGAKLLADTKLPKGVKINLADYSETLRLLDFITPNEQETEYYTGCTDAAQAAALFHSWGVKNVIIKEAERGVYISSESQGAFRVPAFEVPVVDGIGAGDTFAAGLIHALLRGEKLSQAATFASACAALCVSARGAVGAIHSEGQVREFLGRAIMKS